MEDSESAEKQENTGIGAASACLLILRSAHAEDVPRIRRSVRASRRMRTCDWVRPHALRDASQRSGSRGRVYASICAAMLLSMRARARSTNLRLYETTA